MRLGMGLRSALPTWFATTGSGWLEAGVPLRALTRGSWFCVLSGVLLA